MSFFGRIVFPGLFSEKHGGRSRHRHKRIRGVGSQAASRRGAKPRCLLLTSHVGTVVVQPAPFVLLSLLASTHRRGSEICWSICTFLLSGLSSLEAEEGVGRLRSMCPGPNFFPVERPGLSPAGSHLERTFTTPGLVASYAVEVLLLAPQRFWCAWRHGDWSLLFVSLVYSFLCRPSPQTFGGYLG